MTSLDLTIICVYLVGLFIFAICVGLRETGEDFLILSRRAPFALVLFSVVSSWVGVGTTVATAASGYDTGISLGVTAGVGGLVGVVIASLLAPRLKRFGDRFGAHTLADFFVIRYSRYSQLAAAALILIIYCLLTAAQFVGLAAIGRVWTSASVHAAITFAAVSTIVYTAFAGIKSDFYTDIIHFWVMVIVMFFVLLPVVLHSVGGLAVLKVLPHSYFNVFAYGGPAFFAAGVLFGAGVVFVTMEIWQRVYASVSGRGARWALLISGSIIICFYLLSALLGMVTKTVIPFLADRDQALFVLMRRFLPTGVLGLGIAAFMAAFVSSVNTTIMVSSATATKDFYKGWINRDAGDAQLLRAGRLATVVTGIAAYAVALALPDLVALSVNALFMLLILLPGVAGGFFWRRATAKGALYSILVGAAAMLMALPVAPKTAFVPGFVASTVVFITVSLFTSHDIGEHVDVWTTSSANADG